MSEPFIPYARQSIDEEDISAVTEALRSEYITRGPWVERFEEAVATYCSARHAVAFNSGTSALHAAAYALETSPYDILLLPPNTFVATAAAMAQGARPRFVDIDPSSGGLSYDELHRHLNVQNSRGKSLVAPVHFAGPALDMRRIEAMVADPETRLVEDAAHALGSSYPTGERVGCCRWSDVTILSFHPAKTVTSAEGGMALTNDSRCAERLRRYRNNGIERPVDSEGPWIYDVEGLTGNFHMTEMQAALGCSQLRRLDSFVECRYRLMRRYYERLGALEGLRFLGGEPRAATAYHLCVVLIDFERLGVSRCEVMKELLETGIGTQVHYIPLYRHPLFAEMGVSCPGCEEYYSRALSLPLYADLSDVEQDRVMDSMQQILERFTAIRTLE